MTDRTVLFLGASPQQLAPIRYAKAAGHRVVTCDNRPDNPGHRFADVSHDVSTIDREAVLAVAKSESVDAVVCFASDVSAPTAAYVSHQLGLPGNPPDSVALLTHKGRFRAWQRVEGFFVPKHQRVTRADIAEPDVVRNSVLSNVGLPLVVKPVDSSGGKGVALVQEADPLVPSLLAAAEMSPIGEAIAESFVDRRGHQVCGEGFLVDGQIAFIAFADEHFTTGTVVPIGETFPSTHSEADVARGTAALQDIFSRLDMRVGAFNFDLFFTASDEVFVIEIGPRNGGNRMPEAVELAYGVDLIGATVEAALGNPVSLAAATTPQFRATYSIHAMSDGVLDRVELARELEEVLLDRVDYVGPGEPVYRFLMGNRMLGNLLLGFETQAHMLATMARMDDLVHVVLR